jgi:CDP-diacylglycerol---glycerol-3-phosphate 3-phosphatidyltransferase
MNLPNVLTLLRIVLIPFFIIAYYWPTPFAGWVSAVIFALAAITDWLDGYLARKWQQESSFGAFLDPVADKLMVAAALILLVDTYGRLFSEWPAILSIPAIIIVGREIVISALREWMAEIGERAQVAVSMIGKAKTALQMIAIFIMIGAVPGTTMAWVGVGILYAAALLTLWSMFFYLHAAWPHLKPNK